MVADPEEAALFFVPVMVMQMAGNLWHPYKFLERIVARIIHYLGSAQKVCDLVKKNTTATGIAILARCQ